MPCMPRPADTTTVPRPYRWSDEAVCRGLDTEAFFRSGEDAQEAKAACLECPVLTPCRAHALTLPERYGVWGGLDEDERARLLRDARRARKRQGTPSSPAAQAGAA